MSYDVFVFKFAKKYSDPADIPDDVVNLSMGTGDEVRGIINHVYSNVDWQDPSWGIWDSALGSIEFNIGTSDPVTDFAMHIRADVSVIHGLIQLCCEKGWQAMDGEDGFIESRVHAESGLEAWRKYRDQITKS